MFRMLTGPAFVNTSSVTSCRDSMGTRWPQGSRHRRGMNLRTAHTPALAAMAAVLVTTAVVTALPRLPPGVDYTVGFAPAWTTVAAACLGAVAVLMTRREGRGAPVL